MFWVLVAASYQRQRQAVFADGYAAIGVDFVHDTGRHQDESSQQVSQGELHQEVHLFTNTINALL